MGRGVSSDVKSRRSPLLHSLTWIKHRGCQRASSRSSATKQDGAPTSLAQSQSMLSFLLLMKCPNNALNQHCFSQIESHYIFSQFLQDLHPSDQLLVLCLAFVLLTKGCLDEHCLLLWSAGPSFNPLQASLLAASTMNNLSVQTGLTSWSGDA